MPKQLIQLKSTGIKGDCRLVTTTGGYLMTMTTGGKWKWTNSLPCVFVTICPSTPGAGHSRSSTHHWQGGGVSKILGVHITDDLTLTANTTSHCQLNSGTCTSCYEWENQTCPLPSSVQPHREHPDQQKLSVEAASDHRSKIPPVSRTWHTVRTEPPN